MTEDSIPEYSFSWSENTLINSYTPGKTSVSVTKRWADDENRDGIRPEAVTVVLWANGAETDKRLTLDESNFWFGTFRDLDLKQDGELIEYTVKELTTDTVSGTDGSRTYAISIEGDATQGYIVINTHTPETTKVVVRKNWDDYNNQDGIRPDSITVKLLADKKDTGKTLILSQANKWQGEFTNLPKYRDGGIEIVYSIEEVKVDGYELSADGFNLTNKHTPETTTVQVTKTWDDADDQDGIRPDSITVKLLADEKDTGKTLILNQVNKWKGEFTNLPKYRDGGIEIVYSIEEVKVDGYELSADGFNLTNKHIPETTTVQVTKTWDDADDQDGIRPDSITVKLLADENDTG